MQGFTPKPVNQKAVQDEEPSRGITNGSARQQRRQGEMYSLHTAKNLTELACNVCRVLRRDLPIKRRFRAKKLAGELPTTAHCSEEGGAKCVAAVHRELLRMMI